MHRELFLRSHHCIQGERGMDGASIVGPPGPRGPPGRIEVLPSVSIIHGYFLPLLKERRLSTASGLRVIQGAPGQHLALEFLPASMPLLSVSTLEPLFAHLVLPEHCLLVGSTCGHENGCNR